MKYSYKGYSIVDVIVRGIPMKAVRYKVDGKKSRKYCKNTNAAEKWVDTYIEAIGEGKQDIISKYTISQIDDIDAALKILPQGKTLLDCVKLSATQFGTAKNVSDVIDEFLALKQGNVSDHYYADKKNQLTRFKKEFSTFASVTPSSIMKFCKGVSSAPKTQRHYIGTMKEFFDFVVRKDYWGSNPFDKIHNSELPRITRKKFSILNIADTQRIFTFLEEKYPNIVSTFALVAFAGFRVSEAQKIIPEYINFETKEILLPFYKSKTGQTWLQANMPENVWAWLEKYPCNSDWQKRRKYDDALLELKQDITIEDNALRHSFATYHYSLYRDETKTQDLMRHTTAAQLKQTYLAGLVSKNVAEEYFKISPKT